MGRGRSGASKGGGGGGAKIAEEEKIESGTYKEFDDVPSGGWTYAGDGEDVKRFFEENSNVDELISSMDSYTVNAFEDYWAPGHFMSGQQYRGWDGMSKLDQDLTRAMDRVLDRGELKEGIVVRRLSTAELVMGAGKRTATLEELQAMKGRVVTSKGAMSTGAAAQGLTIGSSKEVEYAIKIPGGERSRGSGMWIGDTRINGHGTRQREYLINRDTSFKVGDTTYDRKRGVYVVELLYAGLGEHDYGAGGHGRYRKRR